MPCRRLLPLLSLVFFAPCASAHDLWLIPPEKALPEKAAVVLAHVGMDFPKSVLAPDTDRYPRKFVIQPDGKSIPLESAGKKDLSALLRFEPTTPGIYVVAVETTPKILELDADKFNEYLVTDGLPHIYRLRARRRRSISRRRNAIANRRKRW